MDIPLQKIREYIFYRSAFCQLVDVGKQSKSSLNSVLVLPNPLPRGDGQSVISKSGQLKGNLGIHTVIIQHSKSDLFDSAKTCIFTFSPEF